MIVLIIRPWKIYIVTRNFVFALVWFDLIYSKNTVISLALNKLHDYCHNSQSRRAPRNIEKYGNIQSISPLVYHNIKEHSKIFAQILWVTFHISAYVPIWEYGGRRAIKLIFSLAARLVVVFYWPRSKQIQSQITITQSDGCLKKFMCRNIVSAGFDVKNSQWALLWRGDGKM